jgi:transposase
MANQRLQVVRTLSAKQLAAAARKAPSGRVSSRIQYVRGVLMGKSPEEVGEEFETSDVTVRNWVHRYNEEGLDGLHDRWRSGQPKKLPTEREEEFKRRIIQGPSSEEGLAAYRGEDAREILRREFGAEYSLAGVYLVLHRLRLSNLVPRPEHPGADANAREEFKKNASRSP